jgi:hypothetical protein
LYDALETQLTLELGGHVVTVNAPDFTLNFFGLFKETFEGTGGESSHFIDPKGGALFETLERITPEFASKKLAGSSIAAHCEHTRYYLRILPEFMRDENPKTDWPGSWQKSQVDALEWDALQLALRTEYENVTQFMQGIQAWDDEMIGGGLSMLAHTSYHLGAIRQLAKMLES